ncbi:MAG: type II CRISPR-associated endonuclease Cas1 [Firmicutes bacterium]|nr:type II CRISPR-associated endonuclease Cas1 [Bacillota bacterium]
MSFRTVVVRKRSKIETRLDYLVVRGETENLIHINEIGTLIVETPAVAITGQALMILSRNNVNVVFCDDKHSPFAQLHTMYGNHATSGKIRQQSNWTVEDKNNVWQKIIEQKIYWQSKVLVKYNQNEAATLLQSYIFDVKPNDTSNREGHAAKVYFNALFGMGFTRRTDNTINYMLNYGYSMILSSVSREIVAAGYVTQLGIHHRSEGNQFNLSCDIMEPFRPFVDAYVLMIEGNDDFKNLITQILSTKVVIGGKEFFLDAGIRRYVREVLDCMNGECEMPKIEKFILGEENEL